MKYYPYGHQTITKTDISAVVKTLKSDFLTQGPKIQEFEDAVAKYTGSKYGVAVSNATAALHLAVLSFDIEKGSEGITSPISFVASANCLLYANLAPKFADIDSKTYNIDPIEISKTITRKTKVLIPVHLAGQPPAMKEISKIAKNNGLFIIEDAAQALGSKYPDGSMVGSCKYSDLTVFSFHPVKNITTGEGGVITTNNLKLYKKLLLLRSHGITKDPDSLSENPGPWYYEMQMLGFNYRLTDIQATLGLTQLKSLNKFIKRRREIISLYNKAFTKIPALKTPFEAEGNFSAFHLYILRFDFQKIGKSRKEIMKLLLDKGVGTQVHYIPIHHQPYYQKLGFKKGAYPKAEEYYEQALSIPLYPTLKNIDVKQIINAILGVI